MTENTPIKGKGRKNEDKMRDYCSGFQRPEFFVKKLDLL